MIKSTYAIIYSEYLAKRLCNIIQGQNTVHIYCMQLEYLTRELQIYGTINNTKELLFYIFVAGLNENYIYILRLFKIKEYIKAKNICLAIEANTQASTKTGHLSM